MAAASWPYARTLARVPRLWAMAADVSTVSILETVRRLPRALASMVGVAARRETTIGKPLAAGAKVSPRLNRHWATRLVANTFAAASMPAEYLQRILWDAARRAMAPLRRQSHRPK
jgi:hypothetical protein